MLNFLFRSFKKFRIKIFSSLVQSEFLQNVNNPISLIDEMILNWLYFSIEDNLEKKKIVDRSFHRAAKQFYKLIEWGQIGDGRKQRKKSVLRSKCNNVFQVRSRWPRGTFSKHGSRLNGLPTSLSPLSAAPSKLVTETRRLPFSLCNRIYRICCCPLLFSRLKRFLDLRSSLIENPVPRI